MRPGWTWRFLRSDPIRFANVRAATGVADGSTAVTLSEYVNTQFDPGLSWRDVDVRRTMALVGVSSVAELGRERVELPR